MKKILFVILFLSFFIPTASAESEKEIFDKGVRHFKESRYDLAVEEFTRLIEIAPENADAYKNRGVTYMKQEKFDLAIQDFEKAKALFPELKGLYSNLGVAWYYKKEYEKAIESYNTEIMLEPDHHVAYFNRALCLAELGRNQEALYDLAKTLEIKPDFYWAVCYKADILSQTGEPEKAMQTYKQAIAVSPENDYAKEKLAALKEKTDKQKITVPKEKPKEETPVEAEVSTSKGTETATNGTHEIQVGAFLGKENAERMKKKMAAKGFDARILVLEDKKDRTWYLVRSGNFPDKETAAQAAPLLNKEMGIKSVVRPYGSW